MLFRSKVNKIITDDDSSIKAKLKWSNADQRQKTYEATGEYKTPTIVNSKGNIVPRPDHGELPSNIPEPIFMADPNHRKKTLKGELYRLVKKKKADRLTMTKCDCVRISTNFAYMVRTLYDAPQHEYEDRGNAVLEHHFDNHQHCGAWCRRKTATGAEFIKNIQI